MAGKGKHAAANPCLLPIFRNLQNLVQGGKYVHPQSLVSLPDFSIFPSRCLLTRIETMVQGTPYQLRADEVAVKSFFARIDT